MAAAHTFLKKHPNDPHLTKNMNYYKSLVDVEEYLIDQEEQPYEVRTTCRPVREINTTMVLTFENQIRANHLLHCPECFPEGRDALQQRRFQRRRPKHGAGHHTVL